ncbi:Plant non-specific lipid-transfer protein/Par allergen protein [Dioscorea alata]|uniref:Plant non-specific lipid-transfer protein/Par allergen protein n=1 Tax=Dioscorea alata TaxID=55571 RepID=A0ACB7UGU9_DIOAL|nr:Plant non-specific lipid-transfer protein/Par allergen protein [Dioscorea alata]
MAFTSKTHIILTITITLLFLNYTMVTYCDVISSLLYSCENFVVHGPPEMAVSSECCGGLLHLANISGKSILARRFICSCIVSLIDDYGPNATTIASLPGLCGVYLGFPLDPNIDCNNIF